MKNIFWIILILFSIIQCTATNKNSENDNLKSIIQIELEEFSRGTRKSVIIKPNHIYVENNRQIEKKNLTLSEWKNTLETTYDFDILKIESYLAPTNKRLHDGAFTALIKIKKGDTLYISQGFDAENPPKKLSKLYFNLKNYLK